MTKLIPFIITAIIGCGTGNQDSRKEEGQQKTEIVQQSMLLGEFKKSDLMQEPYSTWFKPGYDQYQPKEKAMETIKEHIDQYDIKIFMGTWCGDSKRETPRFFKILEEANYDMNNLTAIAVDYSKSTPKKYEEEVNLERVPTIIFYKNDQEVNRFVEYAQESLEEDIAKIVSGEEYQNSYAQ